MTFAPTTGNAVRLTFLGTGTSTGVPVPTCDCRTCRSPDPRDRRLRPSVLIEWPGYTLLIDTASDFRQQALRHEIARIDGVAYTHAHADHILGLDDLRLYNWRQKASIPIYGSERTLDAISQTFWYVFTEGPSENTRPALERNVVHSPFELGGKSVIPIPAEHGSLPIFGYRIGNLAYMTDVSRVPESSIELLEGLDVLVLNALRHRPHPTHLTFDQAQRLAERIGARRNYLTHMSHEGRHREIAAELSQGVELAYDGLQIELPDEV